MYEGFEYPEDSYEKSRKEVGESFATIKEETQFKFSTSEASTDCLSCGIPISITTALSCYSLYCIECEPNKLREQST